jgi:hypothetical protein
MNLFDQAELVINRAAAERLISDLIPVLHRAGWTVTCSTDDTPTLTAAKGAGRICVPGGRGGSWSTQVAEVELADRDPDAHRALLPESGEPTVWRVELEQTTPVDLILTAAERAADGPSSVLV